LRELRAGGFLRKPVPLAKEEIAPPLRGVVGRAFAAKKPPFPAEDFQFSGLLAGGFLVS
jgi:hypothetical protein